MQLLPDTCMAADGATKGAAGPRAPIAQHRAAVPRPRARDGGACRRYGDVRNAGGCGRCDEVRLPDPPPHSQRRSFCCCCCRSIKLSDVKVRRPDGTSVQQEELISIRGSAIRSVEMPQNVDSVRIFHDRVGHPAAASLAFAPTCLVLARYSSKWPTRGAIITASAFASRRRRSGPRSLRRSSATA